MLASNALTTLENVKQMMGIEETDTSQDFKLTAFINITSNMIEKHCERKLGVQVYNEELKGYTSNALVLRQYPIIEVYSLTNSTEQVNVDSILVDSEAGIIRKREGGFLTQTFGGFFMHPSPQTATINSEVSYKAGYVLPKDATVDNPRTLPYEIEYACVLEVQKMHENLKVKNGEGDTLVKSESLLDWSASYEQEFKRTLDDLNPLDSGTCMMLDPYVRKFDV